MYWIICRPRDVGLNLLLRETSMHPVFKHTPHFNRPTIKTDYDRLAYTKEPKYQRVVGNSIIISLTLKAHASQIWSTLFPIFYCTGLNIKHREIKDYEYFQAGFFLLFI